MKEKNQIYESVSILIPQSPTYCTALISNNQQLADLLGI